MASAAPKIRPLLDRLLVQRLDSEEKTSGGVIIPDTAKEKPMYATVLAVGPGGRDEDGEYIPIDVKVNDVVLIGKWSGTEIKQDGKEYLIIKESDVLAVVEDYDAKKKAA